MSDIVRCKKCILPTSLPSVQLDEDGVCKHCRDYEKNFANWGEIKEQRKKTFEAHVERVKRLKGDYDCLIPFSGGKDSTFALYICAKVYGLKCLCVTFDNGYFSDGARENIKNAVESTDSDHIYYQINRSNLIELYGHFLRKCGNFCPVCMRGIGVCTQMMVEKFKIPLIVTGDGARITYSAFIKELFEGGDLNFFKEVLNDGGSCDMAHGAMLADPYPWNLKKVMRAGSELLNIPTSTPVLIKLWDYIDASEDEMYDILAKEMNWKRRNENDEHSDCLLHNIIPYIHRLKFPEVTKTTLKNAALVRWGRLSREDAIAIEDDMLKQEVVEPKELAGFLAELNMTSEEFHDAVKDWDNITKYRKEKSGLRKIYRKLAGIS